MSIYDPCCEDNPATAEPAVNQVIENNNQQLTSVLLPLFTQVEQQLLYQQDQLNLFVKSINRVIRQQLKQQGGQLSSVQNDLYTELVNRIAEQGVRLRLIEEMLRQSQGSSQATQASVTNVTVNQPGQGNANPGNVPAAPGTSQATPVVGTVAGPQQAPATATANPVQPAAIPTQSATPPQATPGVSTSSATLVAGSQLQSVVFPAPVDLSTQTLNVSYTLGSSPLPAGPIVGTTQPQPAPNNVSSIVNNAYTAIANSFAASSPAANAALPSQQAASMPQQSVAQQGCPLPPVDLDMPLAFLFSRDDLEWRQRAVDFYGPWLQALINAPTLEAFVEASNGINLQGTEP